MIKINIKKIALILELFLLIRFITIPFLTGNIIYVNLSRFVFCIVFLKYIALRKKISIPVVCIAGYYMIVFVSTYLNDGNYRNVIMNLYPTMGLIMLLEYNAKKDFKYLMSALAALFKVLLVANMVCFLINPQMFGSNIYLIGNANQIGIVYIIGFLCIYLDCILNDYANPNKCINTYAIIFSVAIIGLFYSANAKMAWMIVIGLFYLKKYIHLLKKINVLVIIAAYAAFLYGVVFKNIQQYFSGLITGVFGKNLTFSGRTDIWEIAVDEISENLLLGYGMKGSTNVIYLLKRYEHYLANKFISCHNTFLQEIYKGGLLSLVPLVIYFCYIKSVVKRNDDITVNIYLALIGILFVYMFESVSYMGMFFVTTILYTYHVYFKYHNEIKEEHYDT